MLMNLDEIKEYVPHRYPFIFLDRILTAEPGKSITALKNVTANEPIFQGHFPQQAIFPGVLAIEAMAQAAGVLAYLTAGVKPSENSALYFFAGIDKARFKKIVTPGDQLILNVEFIQEKNNYTVFKTRGVATVDGKVVCSAELLIAQKRGEGEHND